MPTAPADDELPFRQLRTKLLPFLLGGASLVVLVAGMRAAAVVLNPVLFAIFLALLVQPLAPWLQRRRVPAGLATTLVVLLVVLLVVAVLGFLVATVQGVIPALPDYADRLAEQLGAWQAQLEARGVETATLPAEVLRSAEFRGWLLGVGQGTANALGTTALTLFIFAFTVGGIARMDAQAAAAREARTDFLGRFQAFGSVIRRYMWIRAVLGLAAAVLNYLLLLAMGVPFALLWGLLSFILSFVPNIGYTLSVIPPVALALVSGGVRDAAIVLGGYTIINNVLDNVIGPRYVGREMEMSALLSFLSVIFWAWVLGPTGAILAIPLTVFLRDVLLPDDDPPARILPPDAPPEAPPAPPPPPALVIG